MRTNTDTMDYKLLPVILGIAVAFHSISVAKSLPVAENVPEYLASVEENPLLNVLPVEDLSVQPTAELPPDSASSADSQPSAETQSNNDAQTNTEAQHSGEVESTAEAQPSSDVQPAAEAQPAAETQSSNDAQSAAEVQSNNDAQPAAEAQSSNDAQPAAEAKPSSDAQPAAQAESSNDAQSAAEAQSSNDAQPAAEAQPSSDAQPEAEAQPSSDAQPAAEAQPSSDAQPAAEAESSSDAQPAAEVPSSAEAQHNADSQLEENQQPSAEQPNLENRVDTEDQPEENNHKEVDSLNAVTSGLQKFTYEFFKKTAATRTRNLVCSPVSVNVLLAMLAQGAHGLTETELRNGLRLPSDRTVGQQGYRSLIDALKKVTKSKLHLAGKVWTNDDYPVEEEFEDLTENYFRSPTDSLDFYHPELAAEVINEWAQEETEDKIKTVVKPQDVFVASVILTNAVYFKGQWANKFDEVDTTNRPFNIDRKSYKIVPTMYQKNVFNHGYLSELNADYVELPYDHENENDALSMFIVVPKDLNGLKKAINYSEKIDFHYLHNEPQLTPVKLYVPKFKVRTTLNLEPVLQKMGIHNMFEASADFSGISPAADLKVDRFVQKAIIDVNEEGTEAAAVTAAAIVNRNLQNKKEVEFHVDKPFLYVIHHHATNTNVFQGYVRVPTSQ